MDIASLGASPNADPIVQDIFRFGLAEHIVELEAYGFTVIPPEKMQIEPGFIDRLRDVLLRTHEERTGGDLGDWRTAEKVTGDIGVSPPWWWLLERDDVVVESVLNPVVLTLARWLLGQSALLAGTVMILKAKGESPSPRLHNDSNGVPSPIPHYAQSCNTSWVLTDYESDDDGPTLLVPGSHRFGHVPQPYEYDGPPAGATWRMVPLRAKAGSLAVWHGNTWHGGGASRRAAGLRVTLVLYWSRVYMRPVNSWRDGTSPSLIERFPELKRVLGMENPLPHGERNEHPEWLAPYQATARDPFA